MFLFHLGFLEANQDYYTHEVLQRNELDFWDNDVLRDDFRGIYSTHLFARRSEEIIRAHSKSQVGRTINALRKFL